MNQADQAPLHEQLEQALTRAECAEAELREERVARQAAEQAFRTQLAETERLRVEVRELRRDIDRSSVLQLRLGLKIEGLRAENRDVLRRNRVLLRHQPEVGVIDG